MRRAILVVLSVVPLLVGLIGCDLFKISPPPSQGSRDSLDETLNQMVSIAQEIGINLAPFPFSITWGQGIFAVNSQTQEFQNLDLAEIRKGSHIVGFIFLTFKGSTRSQGGGIKVTTPDGKTSLGRTFYIVRAVTVAGELRVQLLDPDRKLSAEVPLELGPGGNLSNPVEVRWDERQSPNQLCYSYVNRYLTLTFCLKIVSYWTRAN